MIPASLEFRKAITHSHQVVTKVAVFDGYTIVEPDLTITDGNVRIDAGNRFRRTCDITLSDASGTLTPAEINGLLAPFGNELLIYRGMLLPHNQTTELIQLGAFVITDVEVGDSGENVSIGVKGIDRGIRVARARLSKAYPVTSGTNTGTAIHDLLMSRWGSIEFARDLSQVITSTMPAIALDIMDDPWEQSVKWAKDSGYSLFFDNTGQVDVRKLPEGNEDLQAASLNFVEGNTCTMLSLRNDLTSENTYTHIVVVGEPPNQNPVWAEAKDEDPDSPTFWQGKLGDITYFYRSPLIRTTEQAQSVANSMMQQHKGHSVHIHFNAIPDPCADVDDIVKVTRARLKVDANYQLDNLTIPLIATRAMECDTRHKYVT